MPFTLVMEMKYWLFQSNQVTGPFDREQIAQIKGFSAESLVCPEGKKGTDMGDWQRAGMLPELSEALLQGTKTPVAAHAGGGGSSLPPEPTLKDLAFLGSLQEKTQILENALGQLREDLNSRDTELARLKDQLGERERAAAELSAKLADTESKIAELRQAQQDLGSVRDDVASLKQIIESQNGQIKRLEQDLTAAKTLPQAGGSVFGNVQLAERLEETTQPLPAPGGEYPPGAAGKGVPPFPAAPAQEQTSAASVPEADKAMPEQTLSLSPARSMDETLSLAVPPMAGSGAAKKTPPFRMGRISEQQPEATVVPTPEVKPETKHLTPVEAKSEPKKEVVFSTGEKKAPNRLIPIVIVVGLLAVVGIYYLGMTPSALPIAQQSATQLNIPAISKAPPSLPDPVDVAREFAKNYKIPGGNETLAQRLEAAYPPSGNLIPWMAEKMAEDKYQVNYYTKNKDLRYEFIVEPKAQKIQAKNVAAESILSGKSPTSLAPSTPAKISKKVAPAKNNAAKRKIVPSRTPKRRSRTHRSVVSEVSDNQDSQENSESSAEEDDVSIDQLLLPGVPKQSPGKKSKKQSTTPRPQTETEPRLTPEVQGNVISPNAGLDAISAPASQETGKPANTEPVGTEPAEAEPLNLPIEPTRH